jgi:hypothetical protein
MILIGFYYPTTTLHYLATQMWLGSRYRSRPGFHTKIAHFCRACYQGAFQHHNTHVTTVRQAGLAMRVSRYGY